MTAIMFVFGFIAGLAVGALAVKLADLQEQVDSARENGHRK